MNGKAPGRPPDEYAQFKELARKLIAVRKDELANTRRKKKPRERKKP